MGHTRIPRWWEGNPRWEQQFDEAVAAAAERRLADTLGRLRRLSSWQRRTTHGGLGDTKWHDAELLWLEGVVLERARRTNRAAEVWQRLAHLFATFAPNDRFFLPACRRCAERDLGFAPNWFSVATRLRQTAADIGATIAAFRQHASGTPSDQPVASPDAFRADPVARPDRMSRTSKSHASPVNVLNLKPKRESIRLAYRELQQPAVVVELSETYLGLDPLDGPVWIWYGHSLLKLGRYDEAAAALQTARGLVTTEDLRGFVLQCQGDLEFHQGRYVEAEARYQEATECEGISDWAWIMLGRVRFRRGAMADAEQCFRVAARMGGKHPATALFELGLILRARSSLFEARRVLREALTLSSHEDVHAALADVERVIRLQARGNRHKRPSS